MKHSMEQKIFLGRFEVGLMGAIDLLKLDGRGLQALVEAITDLRVIVTLNSIECVLQQPIFCTSSRKYVLLYQALEFDNY